MLTLKIGDTFAGCRILDLCGQGGCGTVYLAEDALGERVAVKIVNTDDQERELRGIHAYMAVMRDSPHLLQLRHVGIEAGELFYVMPACDPWHGVSGYLPDTLGNRLKFRGRLDPECALAIVRKIASAVAVLHRAGLIHRDIKPDNIIFIGGEPVLSDPGLLCALDYSISLAGSLGFLPPECFAGRENNSMQSDIYALGKVFYCAVTGEPPGLFPKLPRDLSWSLCRKLFPVLLRACNEKKKRRYSDIEEFQKALPARLPRPGHLARIGEKFRVWRLVHSTLYRAILLALVLALAATGFGVWRAETLRRRRAAEVQVAAAEVAKFTQKFRTGRIRLELQLERLVGAAKTRELMAKFDRFPADPVAARATCAELRNELQAAARRGFEVAWKISDLLRRSGEVRSLHASPLGSFLPAEELRQHRLRLRREEEQLPRRSDLLTPHPGRAFHTDYSGMYEFRYIPPGEFVSPSTGRRSRIDYPFWVSRTKLTVQQFSRVCNYIPNGNPAVLADPVRALLWNDLIYVCRFTQTQFEITSELPPGYIVRPLTEEEWEYCATSGMVPAPDGGNAFGLEQIVGGLEEMVLSERRLHPDSFISRGGKSVAARREPVFYQSFYRNQGARLAIAPGDKAMLDRELRFGTPNHFVHGDRHFEFFGHLCANFTREWAEALCRMMGGHLASIDSEELRRKVCEKSSPVVTYLVCVGAHFRDGKWVWENGNPVSPSLPAPGPRQFFIMENGRFLLSSTSRCLGFVCEWSEAEWKARREWRSRLVPEWLLREFTIDGRRYLLFRLPGNAYPHLLRRWAEILGGRLAEPEDAETRRKIAERTATYQSMPTLLGGIRRYREFYWLTSGRPINDPLPLTGPLPDNAHSLATPAMVNGKLCSVEMARQFLVELPARSAAE